MFLLALILLVVGLTWYFLGVDGKVVIATTDNTMITPTTPTSLNWNNERLFLASSTGATASQYGTWPGLPADYCIDGDNNTVCHSGNVPDENGVVWWEVDLKVPQDINRVEVVNRRDCCSERITGAEIQFLDSQRKLLNSQVFTGVQNIYDFSVRQTGIQYVRIEMRKTEPINLREVRLFVL